MKRRAFLSAGLSSISVGALYGTGAFSAISAGRGVSVNAAEDPDALLGIEGTGSEESLKLTNNATDEQSVTLDAVEDDVIYEINGEEKADPTTIQLDPDESQEILFESTGGREEISIDFTGEIATNQTVITLRRTVQIPQSEQIDLTANVTSSGNSGKFRYEIENTGEVDVTIEDVAVNDATVNNSSDPVEVTDAMVDRNNGNDAPGPIDVLEREPDDEDFVAFSAPISLNIGDQNEFEADKLVDGNGNNARYKNGGTLDVSIRLGDGSVALLEMEV